MLHPRLSLLFENGTIIMAKSDQELEVCQFSDFFFLTKEISL